MKATQSKIAKDTAPSLPRDILKIRILHTKVIRALVASFGHRAVHLIEGPVDAILDAHTLQ